MDFVFDSQGTRSYLVYKIMPEDQVDSMSLGMLTHNKIAGLAETSFTQMDADKYLRYDVTSRVPVDQFFSGSVNRKRLLGVFSGIVTALMSAEDYMIDADGILLDTRYIFADVSSCDAVLICLPLLNAAEKQGHKDVATFFKTLIFSTQFDQTENCDHVAQIINYLNSAATFSLANFQKLLTQLRDGPAQKAAPAQPRPQQAPAQPRPQQPPVQQPVIQQAPPMQQPVIQQAPPPQQPPVQQPVFQAPPPQQPPVQRGPAPQQEPAAEAGEKMSMLYLLRHYSKENAELYKAQRAGGAQAPAKEKPAKKGKKEKGKDKSQPAAMDMGFSVPGAPDRKPEFTAPKAQEPARPAAQPSQQAYTTPKAPPVQQPQPSYYQNGGRPMNFGETTVLGAAASGETTVLSQPSAEAQLRPMLVRKKNNERIMIDKPMFRVGKEKSYVDYFVADNPAVSRSHATILERDGRYFIVDTNSKNHTYVNGQMIPSNEEVELEHGALVVLANEVFEFRLF